MSVADTLDNLTRTFQMDRAFCERLFASQNAETAAALLVFHQWANAALGTCQEMLCNTAPARFGEERGEKAALWTFVLSENMHRDMRLVTYFAIRGVIAESAVVLRRAFEHLGVLTHLWRQPETLDAFEARRKGQYDLAFRHEGNPQVRKHFKEQGSSKRFAAMASPKAATRIYASLSELYVHGGTPLWIKSLAAGHGPTPELPAGPTTCTFAHRADPDDPSVGSEIELLWQGHQLLCLEVVTLCANYGTKSAELVEAAEVLAGLARPADPRSPELAEAVFRLLRLLREEGSAPPPEPRLE